MEESVRGTVCVTLWTTGSVGLATGDIGNRLQYRATETGEELCEADEAARHRGDGDKGEDKAGDEGSEAERIHGEEAADDLDAQTRVSWVGWQF